MMSGIFEKQVIETDTIFGPLLVFADDLITQHLRNFGAHTRTELAFLLSAVEPGDFVFDIGAHVGSFAIPLAEKVGPTGKLLAVEGCPETHALLLRNIERRANLGYCTAINAMIAPHSGAFRLVENINNTGGSYFMPADKGDQASVVGHQLSDIFRNYFVPRVIKLDIEGFECAVLEKTPLGPVGYPILFAEVSVRLLDRAGGSVAELGCLLQDDGYVLFRNRAKGHAQNDDYVAVEVRALQDVLTKITHFNVLAVHRDDIRLPSLRSRWNL